MATVMIRHTRPQVADGVCYGQTDLDVAEDFIAAADAIIAALPRPATIVTSPLRRCAKLAERIGAAFDLDVTADTRLMEMDFGRWETRAWADIPRTELDDWARDFYQARPHGGESVAQLDARVKAAIADLAAAPSPTLMVTHAGVIRAALATGREAEDFQTQIEFGGMIRLQQTERCRDER